MRRKPMTVLAVDRDPVALTLTIVSEFDAPATRVWQVWADPRQLERWWGPPTYPATVVDHDLTPGGRVTYYMTGPRRLLVCDGTRRDVARQEPAAISSQASVPGPSELGRLFR